MVFFLPIFHPDRRRGGESHLPVTPVVVAPPSPAATPATVPPPEQLARGLAV